MNFLITHTDLDGVGCAIIAKNSRKRFDDYVKFVNYDKIDEYLNQQVDLFLEPSEFEDPSIFTKYESIFCTDICPKTETIKRILYEANYNRFYVIDHHETVPQETRELSNVEIKSKDENGIPISATKLFATIDHNTTPPYMDGNYTNLVNTFVDMVSRYDTWEWKRNYIDGLEKKLNDLLDIMGRKRFISYIMGIIDDDDDDTEEQETDYREELFTYFANELLGIEEDRKFPKICSILDKTRVLKDPIFGTDLTIAFIPTLEDISFIGNFITENDDSIDFVISVDISLKVLSMRCHKDSVNVGEIAKSNGGGGHAKASGITYTDVTKFLEVFNVLYSSAYTIGRKFTFNSYELIAALSIWTMRDAKDKESESITNYVRSISKNTGINFFTLLENQKSC